MPNQKPLVTAALFCDDVIIGADGSPTIVRIVDRGSIEIPPQLPANAEPTFRITAFFAVKSGELRGDHEFTIVVRRPDGKSSALPDKWKVHLDGDETGANLKVTLGLPAALFGLYWLELTWQGEVLSRTPFKLSQVSTPNNPPQM